MIRILTYAFKKIQDLCLVWYEIWSISSWTYQYFKISFEFSTYSKPPNPGKTHLTLWNKLETPCITMYSFAFAGTKAGAALGASVRGHKSTNWAKLASGFYRWWSDIGSDVVWAGVTSPIKVCLQTIHSNENFFVDSLWACNMKKEDCIDLSHIHLRECWTAK